MSVPVVLEARGWNSQRVCWKKFGLLAVVMFGGAGFGSQALALTATWDNGAQSSQKGVWATNGQRGDNWNPDGSVPQAAGDVAVFQTTGATTISLGINPSVGTISFNSTASYMIQPGGASTITFDSTAVDNAQLNLASTNTASHRISTSVSLADLLTVSNLGSGTMTLSGTISGAKGITSSGVGTVVLSGSNTYAGATTVSAGSFFIDGNQTGATGTVSVTGGLLGGNGGTIGGNTTIANNAILSPGKGAGTSTLAFARNLTLSGTDSKVNVTISGTSRGTQYDAINLSGTSAFTYNGDLALDFSTSLTNDTTLDLFAFTLAPTGSFDTITLTGLYSGSLVNNGSGVWTVFSSGQLVTFTQSTGDLAVTVPEPATQLSLALGVAFMFLQRRARRSGAKGRET